MVFKQRQFWLLPSVLLMLAVTAALPESVLSYHRPLTRKNLFVRQQLSSTSPEQVHISLAGEDKMRISWITGSSTPAIVRYGKSPGKYDKWGRGTTSSYRYVIYESGQIHDVVIGPLEAGTVFYYVCGSDASRQFAFRTPPAQLPLKFAIAGDLGQTEWTNSTLQHIRNSDYDLLLLPGDLSYADVIQPLWDSFGRLLEPVASSRPWMVTQGNHEIETLSLIHSTPFTAYNARWRMPFDLSASPSNLFYSFDVAGGSVHVIMLGSYTDFGPGSEQYRWLEADLAKLDRRKTPWVVVLVHAPWYNSNTAHQSEPQSVDMKKSMESLLYNGRVDLVLAGHVHAYERFTRVYNDKADNCGPVHITIGDGGNREGLAKTFIDPKPEISVFREASFGHGELQVVNATHAQWTWHRNDDPESTVSDTVWFTSLSSNPSCLHTLT